MQGIDISVVIPVYNLENYIRHCVESIFPVREAKIEILLVDDGSKDNSGKICDELALEYPEIRVIHKPNGGAADTRNAGMQAAVSEYIMFVDGDDFLNDGAVDTIWKNLKNKPEILTFDYIEYYDENDTKLIHHLNAESFVDAAGRISTVIFKTICPLPMPWLYAVKKSYIEEHDIYMHKGLLDEDEEWTARLFAYASKVENLHEYLYYYRRNRANSLTFGRKINNTLADIEIVCILQKEKESGKYTANGCTVLDNKRRQMVNKVLDDLPQYDGADKKRVKTLVKPYLTLLRSGTTADKIHYWLDSLLGRKGVVSLISLLAKLRGR